MREQSLFDDIDEAAEAAAEADAATDIEQGRVVAHSEVAAWLDTWGAPDEKPPPAAWFG